MKGWLRILLTTIWISLFIGNTFCEDTIRIGLMCPLTGKWVNEGQDMRNIVMLLAENINKSGGVNGKKIELIIEDDAGDPRTAALAVQKLVSSGVVTIIGTYGSAVTEATQNIIDEAGIVQIATGSTSSRLTEKGLPLFFRTSPRDNDQGTIAAEIISQKGYNSVAILHDNSSYAKGLAQETRKELEKQGASIVFFDALTPGEQDYSATLTKIHSKNPDLIFFTGYFPEAGLLLRQKSEMNWSIPMMGGDATNNIDLVKIAGKQAAKGYFFVSPPAAYELKTPEAKTFFMAYQKKYHTLPNSVWPILAGDAFNVIIEALRKGKDFQPESIASYLKYTLKDFIGLTGPISFNEYGDRIGNFYKLYYVDDQGAFVLEK